MRDGGGGHVRFYFAPRRTPFAAEARGRFGTRHGPARRRHPVRLLRGGAGDGRGGRRARGRAGAPAGAGGRRRSAPRRTADAAAGLLGLVVFVIFLVLVFALLIHPARASRSTTSYAQLHDEGRHDREPVDRRRQRSRRRAHDAGADGADRSSRSSTAIASAGAAERRTPPSRSRRPASSATEHAHLIQALQLRVSGVEGLAHAFHATVGSKTKPSVRRSAPDQAGLPAARERRRLGRPLPGALGGRCSTTEGVHQVTVPSSHFLPSPT